MESSRWEQIQVVFHTVADLPEAECLAAIEAACGDDAGLKADVTALLEEDATGTPLFDRTPAELAHQTLDPRFAGSHLEELGPYQVIEFLGEGGMGVVYLARRQDLGSLVAIKLLRDAWLSPARRERFAAEQRTLAQLNHPGIARLYDAGILKDGTPWFVMEYVKGLPLTEYSRIRKCSIIERLRLFRAVCEAVQYAHGQAIIHRDLKPSNILVREDGTAKLLDFGIAKHLEDVSDQTNDTQTFLRLMTPGYAAPEQMRGERVGTYTDVYSLGVILYELLIGRLPFDLSKRTPAEVESLVTGTEPVKPSAAARQDNQSGAGNNSGPSRSNWNDLDVLCLTAMHKDASRRYQSAEALIRDIDHYLKDEPLEARPDSVRYKAGKFVRRNRRAIIAASLTFATVVGLIVFFMVRLTKARNAAQAETARTQRVERFMLNLFTGGDQQAAPSSQLRVSSLLDRGARQAAELDSDPQTQADLDQTLGGIYQELGDYKHAEQFLLLAVDKAKAEQERDPSRFAAALVQLGRLRGDQAQFQAAEQLVQQGIEVAKKQQPPNNLALLDAEASLGRVLAESGSYDKAIPVLESVSNNSPSGEQGTYILRDTLSALGVAEYYGGHYDAAKSVDLRSVALDRQLLGESHPRTGEDLMNLGTAEAALGDYSATERHYREGMRIYDAWYGPEHPDSATMRAVLATLLMKEGNDAEAETLLKQALAAQEKAYGPVHDRVALTLDMLGRIALKGDDPQTAEADFSRALKIDQALIGEDTPRTTIVKVDLADAYIRLAKYAEAEAMLRPAVKTMIASLPAGDINIGAAEASWGRALLHLKRYQEAEAELNAAYQNLQKQPRPSSAHVQQVRQDLAAVYEALGQPDQAKQFRIALADTGRSKSSGIH
jgi:serine/threonine protein kinase/lipopolysaccharide biosynthesis regulator YciM